MEHGELEDVLEELYSAGTFDSSGGFSVQADKAREKLARFRLEDPHGYVVHLYSAAYMAGATSFRLSVGLWTSVFDFTGAGLSGETLKDIFANLLSSPQSRSDWAAHELALGLQSGLSGGLKKAVLRTGGQQVVVEGDKVDLTDVVEDVDLRITLFHRRSFEVIWNFFVGRKRLPEMLVLEAAIAPGFLKGTVSQGRWQLCYDGRPTFPDSGLIGTSTSCGYVVLGQGDGLGKAANSRVELSIRGRRFPLSIKFGKGRVLAMGESDFLPLNLSQSAPVLSEEYLVARRRLMERVGALRSRLLLERPDALSGRDKRTLVRQVSRGMRVRAELGAAQSVLSQTTYNESKLAAIKVVTGELEEAEKLLRDELSRDGLPRGLRPARLLNLATVLARMREPAALQTWDEAFELIVEQHRSRKGHLVAEVIESKIPWLLDLDEDVDLAWAGWEQASILKRHLGAKHPRLAVNLERGAFLQWKFGDHQRALELLDRAEEVRAAHWGEGDPVVGESLALRALACHSAGCDKTARVSAQRRLSIMRSVYGNEHPETAASMNLLAWLREGCGDREAAQILEKRGVAEPFEERIVVCFRGWFHSRSAWSCCYPLAVELR